MKPWHCTVLASILALAGLAAAPASEPMPKPAIDQAALDKLGWTLGCQAWTFRAQTLLEALDTLHSLGIHYIEIFPGQRFSPDKKDVKFDQTASDELIKEFLAKCKAVEVTPVSYGVVGL